MRKDTIFIYPSFFRQIASPYGTYKIELSTCEASGDYLVSLNFIQDNFKLQQVNAIQLLPKHSESS
jgi:hypothetical protein